MTRDRIRTSRKKKIHIKFSRWRFEPKPCLQSKDVASDHANYDLNMQEKRAASTVQNLMQQLRQLYMEPSSRHCDCDVSRNGQLHLLAELRDREQAQQEALSRVSQEREELRNARWSAARFREEAKIDATSQGKSCQNIEDKLLESKSTINQLSQQIMGLQEVVNS